MDGALTGLRVEGEWVSKGAASDQGAEDLDSVVRQV